MQKLLTVTIDLDHLKETSKGPFTVNEIEEINTLLEAGFMLEEWNFITKGKHNEKAVLFVVLNDELDEDGFDPYDYINTDSDDYSLDTDEDEKDS